VTDVPATLEPIPGMIQGEGAFAELGPQTARLAGEGAAVLLVADPGLKPSGMVDEALAGLRAAGLSPVLYDDIKSDPAVRQVDAGAKLAREAGARAVVAMGGGSAMDAGKLMAAIAADGRPAMTFALAAEKLPRAALPKICVPTTSGTGSETTRISVITADDGSKQWFWGAQLKADRVILDPALTVGLPPHLTAATGIDALVHAIEAATNRNASPANDIYCLAAIRLVAEHLERAVSSPADIPARAGMQLAAAFGGIAIDNAGTAIGHNIGHALGSLRPIHHGRAVGVAMVATLPWNAAGDPRFAAVAAAMGEPADPARVAPAFERLMRATGVAIALGEAFAGVTPEELAARLVRPENVAMLQSNARQPGEAELLGFARTVLTQA
jgi:alcohol dehydrogenase class IV